MNPKKTVKDLQIIAKENGFYLCPLTIWETTIDTICYLKEEKERRKKIIARQRKEINKLKKLVKK